MTITYLISQCTSNSVRRSSAAISQRMNVGLKIDRYSLRRRDQPLVDDAGKAEQHRTHVALGVGGMGLLLATLRSLLTCLALGILHTVFFETLERRMLE